MIRLLLLLSVLFWGTSLSLAEERLAEETSQESHTVTGPHVEVSLLSEHANLVPGKEQWLGIHLKPDPEWHTYWLNPGDSGEPPKIAWSVDGKEVDTGNSLSFGNIQWPVPYEIKVAHLVNYGYEADNLLMVPVIVSDDLKAGQKLTVIADLSWLVCKEDCIPGWATLSLTLPVEERLEKSPFATLFAKTRTTWPSDETLSGLFEITAEHVILNVAELEPDREWRALPIRGDVMQHNGQQTYHTPNGSPSFILPKSEYLSLQPQQLKFLVTDGETGFYVDAQLNVGTAGSSAETGIFLPLIMLFAFVGGVILNLMPCVLPVLAIKALSVGDAQQTNITKLGYLAGVLVSFVAFAIVIELLKSAGEAVGWGFHMQEPIVILVLCFLFLYLALLLFDIAPGGQRLAGIGNNLTQGDKFSSQFFTGVLAVVVASPCTAPFMGVALGAAMVSSPINSILIFLSLGLGFSLPLTLIFYSKRVATWIPRPGAWMETFKQVLAFPMLATVIWLLWVYEGQSGSSSQALMMVALLCFALSLWALSKTNKIALIIALGLTLTAVVLGLQVGNTSIAKNNGAERNDEFTAWSPQLMKELKDRNQVVLVNMTADWCITCKVNEQVAFQTEEFKTLADRQEVHYLVGDWTNKNQEILGFLNQYDRAGVPLYVIYAGNHYQEVLPQILTPQILSSAIEKAKNNSSSSQLQSQEKL